MVENKKIKDYLDNFEQEQFIIELSKWKQKIGEFDNLFEILNNFNIKEFLNKLNIDSYWIDECYIIKKLISIYLSEIVKEDIDEINSFTNNRTIFYITLRFKLYDEFIKYLVKYLPLYKEKLTNENIITLVLNENLNIEIIQHLLKNEISYKEHSILNDSINNINYLIVSVKENYFLIELNNPDNVFYSKSYISNTQNSYYIRTFEFNNKKLEKKILKN